MARILPALLSLFVSIPASLSCVRSSYQPYASSPDFCKGLECPRYNVTSTGGKYEERLYEAANWVSTEVLDMDYEEATSEGFRRLFKYIKGQNEEETDIPMTAPVATRIIPGEGPYCESNFTIYFFVPFDLQSSPPAPTDSRVFITSIPERTLYVKSFSGFASQDDWIAKALELEGDLRKDSRTFVTSYYYTAGYDSPFTFFKRHNEVWFLAE